MIDEEFGTIFLRFLHRRLVQDLKLLIDGFLRNRDDRVESGNSVRSSPALWEK